MTKGGCHESTRFADGSGAVSPQRRGLRTNLLRQRQSSAAAGCYERLVRAIGGTGHCAGPFLFVFLEFVAALASAMHYCSSDLRQKNATKWSGFLCWDENIKSLPASKRRC